MLELARGMSQQEPWHARQLRLSGPAAGRGTEPCPGPQCTQRLSPGELSTAGKKSQRNEASPVARWRGHPLGPTAPAGAAAGVCGGWG